MVSISNNTTTFICEPTENEWGTYSTISWWMDGIASPVIASSGMLLNTIACVTLISSKKIETIFFNRLLVCLAIFDNLFLSIGISEAIRKYVIRSSYIYDYAFIKFIFPFRSMVMFCSMYTTIILAFIRHSAIKNPLNYKARSEENARSYMSVVNYITPVFLSSILFYSPKFFEFNISHSHEMCQTNYSVQNTSENIQVRPFHDYLITETNLRKNKSYIFWYSNIFNHIVTLVLPLILLVFFNLGIYFELKSFKSRQPSSRRQMQDTKSITNDKGKKQEEKNRNEQSIIVISLVFMFILCHFIRAVLNIQELVNFEWKFTEITRGCAGVKYWAMVLVPFSEFMLLTNSSANFFIYFLFHNEFRHLIQKRRDQMITGVKDKMNYSRTNCGNVSTNVQPQQSTIEFFECNGISGTSGIDVIPPKHTNKIEMIGMVEIQDDLV